MVNITGSFKIFEKAKETASFSKERLGKWAEAKKMKKYKQNVERKDLIGNQILFAKKQIAETEEKVNHLNNVSVRSISVNIEGMDFALSTESILAQYEETLTVLLKRKDKMIREFLSLEESIKNEKEIGEKVEAMEKQKKERYQAIKTNSKETILAELLPLIAEMTHFVEEDEPLILEETFGLLELRYQGNRLEARHNGLIVNVQLDQFGDIELAAIGDWYDEKPIRLAKGTSKDITLLKWENHDPMNYLDDFFEMGRAIKFVYTHHEELVQQG